MKYLIMITFFAVSINCLAGEYSYPGKIKRVQTNGWNVHVITESEMKSAGCNYNNQYTLVIDSSYMERSQIIYSTILAAYLSGKEVKFWLDECEDGFPRIKDVIVGEPL